MKNFKILLGTLRIPFLILAPACAVLGIAAAGTTVERIPALDIVLVLLGAVLAHIGVNVFNEYQDFKTGLDTKTRRTPFSGGSGALQQRPDLVKSALAIALAATVLTAAIGIYFIVKQGIWLLPVGLVGLVLLYAYTAWTVYHPFLCLIAPGLGFGTLMVLGTQYALTGQYTWTSVMASLIPFFLVSNLLLLNQFPDVEADQSVGKRTYPVILGRRKSSWIYIAFLALTYVSILLAVILRLFPAWSLLGFLTLPLAVMAGISSYRNADDLGKLMPALGMNVLINILTPVLVAIGLFI